MNDVHQRIGILKPCCIGDAVMALPVIDNILRAKPSALVEVWCGDHTKTVFENYPGVSNTVEIPSVLTLSKVPALAWRLRSSTNIGFFILDRSRLISLSSRIAGIRVLGTVRSAALSIKHETDCYLETLVDAGIDAVSRLPAIQLDALLQERALARLGLERGRYIVLHPGGAQNPGATMHSKRWPMENWIAVARWLESRSITVVLTGGPDEVELCRAVAAKTQALIAAGQLSLMESAAIASTAAAFVGPDTGLSHLAAAAGAPVVAIFGPTNPRQYAPRGAHVTVLAPTDSYAIPPTDLRNTKDVRLPTTADVSVDAVIAAISANVAVKDAVRCL